MTLSATLSSQTPRCLPTPWAPPTICGLVAHRGVRVIPKGYWIAHITITDAVAYKQYRDAFGAAFKKYGARDIIRGAKESPGFPKAGRLEIKHGTMKDRHVVIEFDSYEQALACYDSPEYQSAAKFRERGAQVDLIIIEGCDPPFVH